MTSILIELVRAIKDQLRCWLILRKLFKKDKGKK